MSKGSAAIQTVAPLVVWALLGATPAIAQAPAQSDCRQTAKIEREMTACLASLTLAQDKEMATLVQKLRQRATEGNEKAYLPLLDRAQRQWRIWRDAECQMETYESRQGSGFATILATCHHARNAGRTKTLLDMVDSP